ncbi:MAG TPA: hypothetical protein VF260_10645 [Bacilli bacterium]
MRRSRKQTATTDGLHRALNCDALESEKLAALSADPGLLPAPFLAGGSEEWSVIRPRPPYR